MPDLTIEDVIRSWHGGSDEFIRRYVSQVNEISALYKTIEKQAVRAEAAESRAATAEARLNLLTTTIRAIAAEPRPSLADRLLGPLERWTERMRGRAA